MTTTQSFFFLFFFKKNLSRQLKKVKKTKKKRLQNKKNCVKKKKKKEIEENKLVKATSKIDISFFFFYNHFLYSIDSHSVSRSVSHKSFFFKHGNCKKKNVFFLHKIFLSFFFWQIKKTKQEKKNKID